MINEFTILKNASATYRAQAGDKNKRSNCILVKMLDDTADAAINYLKAVKAVQDEEANDKIWIYMLLDKLLLKNQKHMDSIMLTKFRICRKSTTYRTIY